MIDVLLEAPELYKRAEAVQAVQSPQSQLAECMELVRLCWKLDGELGQFWTDFSTSIPGPMYWPVFSGFSKSLQPAGKDDSIFPLEFDFVETRIAIVLTLYWAALLVLHSGMSGLYYLVGAMISDMAQRDPEFLATLDVEMPPLEHRSNFMVMVQNVCQSVPYCMRDDMSLPFVIAPLNVVIQVLKQWPGAERELEWARMAIERIRLEGVSMVAYLPQHEDLLGV